MKGTSLRLVMPISPKRMEGTLRLVTTVLREERRELCASLPLFSGRKEGSMRLMYTVLREKGGLYAPHIPQGVYTQGVVGV